MSTVDNVRNAIAHKLLRSLTIDNTETAMRYGDLVFTQHTGWSVGWNHTEKRDLTLDQVIDLCIEADACAQC